MSTSTMARKKNSLHKLITNNVLGPWTKLKPNYIETLLVREDDTGKDIFLIRVNKLPPTESFPLYYMGVEVIYVELPLDN